MLKIVPSNQFKKDLKLAIKRKANIKELENVVDTLAKGLMLDKKYRDHFYLELVLTQIFLIEYNV